MRLLPRLLAGVMLLALGPAAASAQKNQELPSADPVDLSQPLTLDRAIRIGLENQNTLGIAKVQLEASRARQAQARASYFPQIAPTFEYSNQLSAFGAGGGTRTTRVEQRVAQIGLRQLVFDMGKREENVRASRAAVQASQYNLLDTRQTVIENVTTSFFELMRRKELVKVAQASVDRAKTALEATRAFVEAGTSPEKDIPQAEADYENAQVQLIQAENAVRLAATQLKSAMGILTLQPVAIADMKLADPPDEADEKPVREYLQLAYDRRLDVRRDQANIQADRADLRIAEINAGFQVQSDFTEGYRVYPNTGENRAFVTTFSYPLFDAGLSRARVQQSRAFVEQSQRQLELTRQGIQLDVEQAYLQREEARLRSKAAEIALKAAQRNYEFATESRREGAGTIIDVITAQAQLVTAETNAVQAIFDYHTAEARLKRAVGENDTYDTGGKPS